MASKRHKRHSQLTPELHRQLVGLRRTTRLFDTQIALKCGVADATLRTWVAMGVREGAQEPYLTFSQEYSDASIDVENEALEVVREGKSGKEGGDWKAAAWFLERFRCCRWGNSDRVPQGGPKEALDVQQIIEAGEERKRTLTELFDEPPPELVAAMVASKDRILALLSESAGPELPAPAVTDPKTQ
jgi:hypothetical protein